MSKEYTVSFTLHEGDDEFWDGEPSTREVADMIAIELSRVPSIQVSNVKIVGMKDFNIYEGTIDEY